MRSNAVLEMQKNMVCMCLCVLAHILPVYFNMLIKKKKKVFLLDAVSDVLLFLIRVASTEIFHIVVFPCVLSWKIIHPVQWLNSAVCISGNYPQCDSGKGHSKS